MIAKSEFKSDFLLIASTAVIVSAIIAISINSLILSFIVFIIIMSINALKFRVYKIELNTECILLYKKNYIGISRIIELNRKNTSLTLEHKAVNSRDFSKSIILTFHNQNHEFIIISDEDGWNKKSLELLYSEFNTTTVAGI